MHATIRFTGVIEKILDEAVHEGIAKTKTEALRMAVLQLNDRYNLLEKSQHEQQVVRKMQKIDLAISKGERKVLSEARALGKYR